MLFVMKVALRDKDVDLLDQLVEEANEAERRSGGFPGHDRENMLASIGTLGLTVEHQRRRLGQADQPALNATQVEYGRTFNLGKYETERIGVWVPIGADETPRQALDQARRWVEQQHQQGREVEHLEQRLARLNLQIGARQRDLQQIKRRLDAAVQTYELLRKQVAQHGGELVPFHFHLLYPASEPYVSACNRLQIALHASVALAEQSYAMLSADATPEELEQLRAALETVRRADGQTAPDNED